jgi:hypothetical protein
MKKVFVLAFICLLINNIVKAQGCVAIKGNGASCMMVHTQDSNIASWQFSASTRYFKSFRHFSGSTENKDRLVQHSEVINHTTVIDLALTRVFNDRWSVMLDIPIINNGRSSLYHSRQLSA